MRRIAAALITVCGMCRTSALSVDPFSFFARDVGSSHHSENESEARLAAIDETNNHVIGRRQLFLRGMIFSSAFKGVAAHAQESTALLPVTSSNRAVKSAICDPTVESYRKGASEIHIVGTAHISSISARLSREVVREARPEAVFIELDLQRISRAFRNGKIDKPITVVFFTEEKPDGGGRVMLQSAILAPQDLQKNTGWIGRLLGKIVSNPIQDFYESLESQGITPGEEFITAVEEGANSGSVIILGDRRMDITMRRLGNALVFHTDPQKLAEADRIITAKLKDRMPEMAQLEEELKQQKRDMSPEELAMFVERIKTKETTEEIMTAMKNAAPDLHMALVGERDLFMARGMDIVFSSPPSSFLPPSSLSPSPSSIQTIVAVIGLGHMSGVTKELQSLGWRKFVPYQC